MSEVHPVTLLGASGQRAPLACCTQEVCAAKHHVRALPCAQLALYTVGSSECKGL